LLFDHTFPIKLWPLWHDSEFYALSSRDSGLKKPLILMSFYDSLGYRIRGHSSNACHFYWPILDPAPPCVPRCDVTFLIKKTSNFFNVEIHIIFKYGNFLLLKKHFKLANYTSKRAKKCHVTLWLTPYLLLVLHIWWHCRNPAP